ncbi:Methyladenine glycosylase [Musa troglodytarum]|uniref:Methyladenine glycosylase n=1 Tax=Musa troglodytarum TaxID=320322 RepID=A0A9E7FAT1_9LILI|nr:Methyladenine glycosylase [Musa troglodytarum]
MAASELLLGLRRSFAWSGRGAKARQRFCGANDGKRIAKEAFADLPRSPCPTEPEQDTAPDPNPFIHTPLTAELQRSIPCSADSIARFLSRAGRMGRHVLERSPMRSSQGKSSLSRHLQRVYPLGIQKSCSMHSLSSLSLSQNSNASSLNSSMSSWDPKIPVSVHKLFSSWESSELLAGVIGKGTLGLDRLGPSEGREASADDELDKEVECAEPGSLKRCNWITHSSDEAYVSFHDEYWGVPVYDDKEAFAGFDHILVAKMEEKEIMEISSNKELVLAECRVRCIVDNAKCMQRVAKEFGSFSVYIWGHVNRKPLVNRYKYPRSVPLRTPKSEAISKDLVRRGFRLVGPVIVYSFMQAAGIAMDHLVGCFRFGDCVRLAERSWGLSNLVM